MLKTSKFLFLIFYFNSFSTFAQSFDSVQMVYENSYKQFQTILHTKSNKSFRKAVFIVENAFFDNTFIESRFDKEIKEFVTLCKGFHQANPISNYTQKDKSTVALWGAVFKIMTDTVIILLPNNEKAYHLPFVYDFDDFYGDKDYQNIFVTKLLRTHTGQCRSMPMLYKILAEEIGAESYLALAPNHLYIKHLDEQNKWVNVELTNGHFSSDAWMISSSGMSAEAIQSGIYMKDLTMKESIAFCMTELAMAYKEQYGHTEFSLLCCEASIKHHKNSVSAILHKHITLKNMGLAYKKKYGNKPNEKMKAYQKEWLATHYQLNELGHREVSKEQYAQWAKEMDTEKEKRQTQAKN